MSADPQMDRAIEVFAKGFADVRSLTHPYLARRVGRLWRLHDGPRKKEQDYRREEWIGHSLSPKHYDDASKRHSTVRHCVSAICPSGVSHDALKEGFKSLGYRFGRTEAFMVHALRRVPRVPSPVDIQRVLDPDVAEQVNRAAGQRQILADQLYADAPVRQYAALSNGHPVGWVRSHAVEDATWCSSLYVQPEYRRRGIARALMCTMLRNDRKYGSTLAVLTASHAGANLYPLVGYRQIGTLLFFTPPRKKQM